MALSPTTVKMVTMFFLAALFLNCTNYMFYSLYDSSTHPAKVKVHKIKRNRSFRPLRTVTMIWTDNLVFDKVLKNVTMPETKEGSYPENQSSDSGHFYEEIKNRRSSFDFCPEIPPRLGPIQKDMSLQALDEIENMFSELLPGGAYDVIDCKSLQSVALIIPLRDHAYSMLGEFLFYMHPFLIKQQLEYRIFVVEQHKIAHSFNRGTLFNIGFVEAQKFRKDWQCFVFMDLHLLPLDSRNMYRCDLQPKKLLAATVENDTVVSSLDDVIAIIPEQFMKVNGFSNLYRGAKSMGIYNDMHRRLNTANYSVIKSDPSIGKFVISKLFKRSNVTPRSVDKSLTSSSPLYLIDGLSTLSYKLNSMVLRHLFTHLTVTLDSTELTNRKEMWNKLFNRATLRASNENTLLNT